MFGKEQKFLVNSCRNLTSKSSTSSKKENLNPIKKMFGNFKDNNKSKNS